MTLPHQGVFASRRDLEVYGDNALLLFALETKFQIDDIEAVATNSLTDGSDDKSCDLVYVDSDLGHIVVAQGYFCKDASEGRIAKSKKASDLNTAAAWLFNSPIDKLPERLQSVAIEVHSALEANSITDIQFWYVHNLSESSNVKDELHIVEQSVNNTIQVKFPNSEIKIRAI